jgi:stage II sporulation protein D
VLFFVSVCLLAGAMPVVPALADPTADQLNQLRVQEQNQRAQLDQLRSQQQSAQATLSQIQAEYDAKQADYQQLLSKAEVLSTQIAAMDAHEKQLQLQHDERIQRFRGQSRVLYKAGPAEAMVFLFEAGNFSDFLDRLFYITDITRSTFDQARKLRQERETLLGDRARTAKLKADLDPMLAQLAALAAEASGRVGMQAIAASEIDGQQRAAQAALYGTQRRERQLEAALAAAAAQADAAARKGAGLAYGPVCPAAPAGTISFCGHGWGHGVGLGQYGALGMAQAGIGWPQIIHSFYTGVTIGTVPDQTVRVYLTGASPPAGTTITPRSGGATIVDAMGAPIGGVVPDQPVSFTRNGDGSVSAGWAGHSARAALLRLVPSPGGIFQVSGSGTHYRGEAWVDGSLKVINHVELESYLQGISEVPSSWPLDAIAAQTVAARSYAVYHLGGGGPYDVDDTTNFQVYRGVDRETASQNAAVAATRLQGAFANGRIIDAVFSSSDGGHTQCASAEWGSGDNPCTPSYLSGVIDNYDKSPLHTWYTNAYTPAQIQQFLVKAAADGHPAYDPNRCGMLVGFDLSDRDRSDRLNTVKMIGTRGVCVASPGAFMRAANDINNGSPADFVVYSEMFGVTPGNRGWPYW